MILPKKRKEIEGLSANTLIELKAAISDQNQKTKQRKKPRIEKNPLLAKNKGILLLILGFNII
jgi:hypothetical protein